MGLLGGLFLFWTRSTSPFIRLFALGIQYIYGALQGGILVDKLMHGFDEGQRARAMPDVAAHNHANPAAVQSAADHGQGLLIGFAPGTARDGDGHGTARDYLVEVLGRVVGLDSRKNKGGEKKRLT